MRTFLLYGTHFLWGGLLGVGCFSCFRGYRRRALAGQKLHSGPLRELALHFFVLWLFGTGAMILWPGYHFETSGGLWGNLVVHNARESLVSNWNPVPFRMIASYLRAFSRGHYRYAVTFFLGNILVFVPLGLLLPLLFSGYPAGKVTGMGLGISLGCECLQFFLGRHCDVDDILLNTLGMSLGYALFLALRRLSPEFAKKFRCSEQT